MTKLRDVLGAVLREATLAQAMGDRASRDVAAERAKDDVLRLLPAPRAEIREITLTLRFAVASVASRKRRQGEGDLDADVLVTKEELEKVPESQISTLAWTTTLGAYRWTRREKEEPRG